MKKKSYGQSTIEFLAMVVILLAALLYFQKYIVRSLSGRWKGVGDSLGQGRIYDPQMSAECTTKKFFAGSPAIWYNQICFEKDCMDDCVLKGRDQAACDACLISCQSDLCEDPAS